MKATVTSNRIPLRAACCATSLLAVAWATLAFAVQAPAPDSIYFHGTVHTVDDSLGTQSAFAVRGDRIVAVGSDAEILALAGGSTRRVDLREATVIPGLSDNHDHLWNAGKYLVRGVDLIGVSSREEMEARLQAAVAKARKGTVVYTTIGWAVSQVPTREDLDRISATVPIALIRSRRGVGVLNSPALRQLGVTKENPTYNGAKLPLDSRGELTGELPGYPAGVQMVDRLLPPLTVRDEEKLLLQAVEQRHALGITSVRELALWPAAVKSLQRLRRQGKLKLRMALGVEFPDETDLPRFVAQQAAPKRDDPWLFVDSLSEEPWAPGSATLEGFTQLVRAESRSGWRPAPHVSWDVGRGIVADVSIDMALTAYESINRDSPLNGKRWYLEHVPLSTPAQMDRMAALGLIISTQDAGRVPLPVTQVPTDRLSHLNPVRGLLDHKLIVIGGSDYLGPIPATREPNNPIEFFQFYVTRKMADGKVQQPDERISREQALRIFTVNPAYATFQESVKGRIAPGLFADFVILNQDLMKVPEEQLAATRPLATFVAGQKVYAAAGAPF